MGEVRFPRGDLLGSALQPLAEVAELTMNAVQRAQHVGGYGIVLGMGLTY